MGARPTLGEDRECRPSMSRTAGWYDPDQLQRLSDTTIAYYDRFARAFWEGTRHHGVSQNYAALLNAIESEPPFSILDPVVDPAGISVTSDPWGTKPWGSMDLGTSSPWRARIRNARSSIRIFWRCNCPRIALTAFLQTRRCSMCPARNCRGFCWNCSKR